MSAAYTHLIAIRFATESSRALREFTSFVRLPKSSRLFRRVPTSDTLIQNTSSAHVPPVTLGSVSQTWSFVCNHDFFYNYPATIYIRFTLETVLRHALRIYRGDWHSISTRRYSHETTLDDVNEKEEEEKEKEVHGLPVCRP